MQHYALFCRIKYNGAFRAWQFSGFEDDAEKVKKFIADVQEENGLDSVRVYNMGLLSTTAYVMGARQY